jgi:WD40 repeat protein
VRLWDFATGEHLHQWSIPTDHFQDGRVAFSPKGNLLAAASTTGAVHVWDVASRAEHAVFRGHRSQVHDVVFSPDSRWLASSGADGDYSVQVWDMDAKQRLYVLTEHEGGVMALAVTRDGKILASGSKDGTVRLWNTTSWKRIDTLNHGTPVYGVAFTPDGTRLATACADNSIRFWDVPRRQEVAELRIHTSYVKALAFSPDGKRLASASGDFTVRIWDTVSTRDRSRAEKPAD